METQGRKERESKEKKQINTLQEDRVLKTATDRGWKLHKDWRYRTQENHVDADFERVWNSAVSLFETRRWSGACEAFDL
jgi:hypothetical protein